MSIQQFNVIGISVRTTNENGQSAQDIPALWNKFMTEGIQQKIPGKISEEIFCIYTDYEKDHTKPYTTILGCKVESLDFVPENMVGKTIESADYEKIIAKGNLTEGIVYNKWLEIWNSDLDRIFTADFEVYGEKVQNPKNAEVDIYIAIR
ncbi:GyrI-like domain-containing protein [Flavobacterium sp. FlaQc-28]|uniref:GyrI-like domain-containing protein n=1 Tax=Flavobacterium sp. FlaQc-28 TaxID=3374178 RepID=UPI0037578EEE